MEPSLHSFFDELTKIAATVSQLAAGARRVGRGSVRSKRLGMGERLARMPGKEQKREHVESVKSHLQNVLGWDRKAFGAEMSRQAGGYGKPAELGSSWKALQRSKAEVQKGMDEARKSVGALPELIVTPTGGAVRQFSGSKRLADAMPKTPAGQKAVNVSGVLHEGFEGTPGKFQPRYVSRFGHASPRVILNESNMMSGMKGPGASEAKRLFSKMRERKGGEAENMQELAQKALGERGAELYGQYGKQKIPKRVRRAMESAYE